MTPYTLELREQLRANLARHTRREHPLDGRRHAAVAIVIVDSDAQRDGHDPYPVEAGELSVIPSDVTGLDGQMSGVAGGAAFLLCRRAAKMRAHARQWALPGGRCDPGETPAQTALRELHEELGLLLHEDAVLGVLDDYPTRSGYVITPVVVWGGDDARLERNPGEVAEIHRVPLAALLRPEVPRLRRIPESDRPVISIPLSMADVHAPTAAIVYQLREVVIRGEATRVAHFDQPVFAWR